MRNQICAWAPLFICGLLAGLPPASNQIQAAEPSDVIDLWPGTPPGPAREVGEEADQSGPDGRRVAGKTVIRLGNVSTPQAHVYLPPVDRRTGSAVVVCPGGGFNILAWDLEGTEVAEWLNSIGVAAIVLKYRVPTRGIDPVWLLPVQDAQRSISIVRSRAAEWGLKADQIGVLGFSAGGQTAVRAALTTERLYEPVDDDDKASFLPNAAMLIYPAYLTNKANTELAEGLEVTKKSPPMFMVHAFDDRIPAEGSLLLTIALKQAGVPSEVHVYDTGGHGYGLRAVDDRPVTSWPGRCRDWLQRINWLK
ncbi:MAG: alpha/beta hydrolase [Fuerstiella sp.]